MPDNTRCDSCRPEDWKRPLINNRPQHQNPFGPTLFYGTDGLVFEVVQASNHLATVAVFADQP